MACDRPRSEDKPKPKVWSVSTLAGSGTRGNANGTGTAAQFDGPQGMVLGDDEKFLYIADTGNHRIRKLVIASGEVTTLAGSTSGSGSASSTLANAQFDSPNSIVAHNGKLYVADDSTHKIREIDIAAGTVTALGGNVGTTLNIIRGLAIAPDGSKLYVLEKQNAGAIYEIDMTSATKTANIFAGDLTTTGLRMVRAVEPRLTGRKAWR